MKYTIRNILAYMYSVYLRNSKQMRTMLKEASEGKIILSVYSHNPSRRLFKKVVRWYKRNGFQFISADILYDILTDKIPFPKKAVFLSLDDGWKENYSQLIPVIHANKIDTTIFIPTEPVLNQDRYWWSYIENARKKNYGRYSVKDLKKIPDTERRIFLEKAKRVVSVKREAMLPNEVSTLKLKNVIVGSHTISHPILTMCTDKVVKNEIIDSKKQLEEITDSTIDYFSYPNGCYGKREIQFVKDAGYKMAFTTIAKYVRKDLKPDLFLIPRFDILENVSFSENICRMTGIWFKRKNRPH